MQMSIPRIGLFVQLSDPQFLTRLKCDIPPALEVVEIRLFIRAGFRRTMYVRQIVPAVSRMNPMMKRVLPSSENRRLFKVEPHALKAGLIRKLGLCTSVLRIT
ncbi:hypothetical protein MAP00_007567 [Monascus purpureus]|nr:hypothetical protein MAP00_007567 [Monascus purpureus]